MEVPDGEVVAARADRRRGRELERRRREAAGRRRVELGDRHPTVAHLECPHLERHRRGGAPGELRQAPDALRSHEPDPRGDQRQAADEDAAAQQREWRVDDLDSRHARDGVARDRHAQVAEHERAAEGPADAAEIDLRLDARAQQREHSRADHLLDNPESARSPQREGEEPDQGRDDDEPAAQESRHQNLEPRLTWTCQRWSPSGGWKGKPRSTRRGPTGDR